MIAQTVIPIPYDSNDSGGEIGGWWVLGYLAIAFVVAVATLRYLLREDDPTDNAFREDPMGIPVAVLLSSLFALIWPLALFGVVIYRVAVRDDA